MPNIAVIGTTTWGKTLAAVLSHEGSQVRLWARTEREADALRGGGADAALFPDVPFPPQLSVTSSLDEALAGAEVVIVAVPSQTMRRNMGLVGGKIGESVLVISAAKGFELGSLKRMSQVIAEEIAPPLRGNVCVLSGPNLSGEILRGLPAATVVAAEDEAVAERARKLLTAPNFCVYTNTDVMGVELGGALKNIVALGAGMVDGLGCGDNAKAAFITRCIIEISALGLAMGANPLTFAGLAGLGDTIATCASPLSRNHYVGVELTKGRSLKEITESMTGIAEGVNTTAAAHQLAQQRGLKMPITDKIYQVLFEGADPSQAVAEAMAAEAGHELSGQRWELHSFSQNNQNHRDS